MAGTLSHGHWDSHEHPASLLLSRQSTMGWGRRGRRGLACIPNPYQAVSAVVSHTSWCQATNTHTSPALCWDQVLGLQGDRTRPECKPGNLHEHCQVSILHKHGQLSMLGRNPHARLMHRMEPAGMRSTQD